MSSSPDRMERIRAALTCPACHGGLRFENDQACCESCGAGYPMRRGKIYFIDSQQPRDSLDSVKHRLKRWFGRFYYRVGITVFAPTYPFNYHREIIRFADASKQLVVDLGCGNHRIDSNIITVDAADYDAVDIVADLQSLPFKSNSVDAFASRSVLEHVQDPKGVVGEIMRCTRSGGFGVHLIPFLFPYHASPYDFQRFTHKGAALLFDGWQVAEQRNATGPFTLFLLWLIEFLAILFSLGIGPIKARVYLVLCILLFPLKFLDAPFVGRKAFLGMAPSIVTVVRKP